VLTNCTIRSTPLILRVVVRSTHLWSTVSSMETTQTNRAVRSSAEALPVSSRALHGQRKSRLCRAPTAFTG
jgi:hypothetical protein